MCATSRLRDGTPACRRSCAAPTPTCCACRESFDDPVKLLEAAVELGLEGICLEASRPGLPFRPKLRLGQGKDDTWREANRDRWEMFERR